ncbi:MAG: two-component sensor histidine kinase [Burkholderiales bacterium PBB6]|uniref:histidine kinase n=1 Tax=Ideonella margarita TaxID=2984191 RepID=A0ABU9C3B4_9BURK|nr:MAG: two-component sensor histidine kinase [Burkholderiales bacterium PBB6]
MAAKKLAAVKAPPLSLNLFWRTFVLLAILLAGGITAWVITLRQLEFEPRAVQAAQQIASLVNLSRAALRYSDGINRIAVVKTMSEQEAVRVLPREPGDQWEPFATDRFTRLVTNDLRNRLGEETLVARSVNGVPALWVGFNIGPDPYWMQAEYARLQTLTPGTWFVWVGVALLATLLGSAAVARLINKPLKNLSFAASRIREGEFDSRLDETTITSEIRAVNIGFNRMARELAKVEEERAVMLAGISHDLRTPLARLRLEAEISVSDDEARRNMAMDIDQLDAIIDKFMDYARPDDTRTVQVDATAVVEREAASFRDTTQIRFSIKLPPHLIVMGDDTELGRVFANLFENARRYGRSIETGVARVSISHVVAADSVIITVRDHGPGVAPEKLGQLTTPFFRGDAARTAATGAGLGLAIVKKALQRIDAGLELANARDGGLIAHIRLKRG